MYISSYVQKTGYTKSQIPGYSHSGNPQGCKNALISLVAAAAMIWNDFVEETKTCDAEAVTHECPSKGQVLFYIKGFAYDMAKGNRNYHVDVVYDLDGEDYLDNVCRLIK